MYLRLFPSFISCALLTFILVGCARQSSPRAAVLPAAVLPVKADVTPLIARRPASNYVIDCLLWNQELPRNESLIFRLRDTRDGQLSMWRFGNLSADLYERAVKIAKQHGRPVVNRIDGRNGWRGLCGLTPNMENPGLDAASSGSVG